MSTATTAAPWCPTGAVFSFLWHYSTELQEVASGCCQGLGGKLRSLLPGFITTRSCFGLPSPRKMLQPGALDRHNVLIPLNPELRDLSVRETAPKWEPRNQD
uniref:Uncharacterized protein n=1 Tax=Dromaius novaehollandiae TaxID=8790 RepID=A0A8C4P9Q9_DRONO